MGKNFRETLAEQLKDPEFAAEYEARRIEYEASDNAFCEKLCQQYETDSDKGEIMTEAELCRELGISL